MNQFALQTRGLRKVYGEGDARVEALRGIDLDVRKGDFVSIMGPSGSGKSTLLHLIGLLDAPTAGGVRLNGLDASRFSARERTLARRESLGFVFQAFHLIPRASAIRNVILPMALAGVPRAERRPRAEAILRSVGLGDRMRNTPSQLSGGQKQRVAIARALALDPPIILADEPTGNLDTKTGNEIMQLFTELNRRGKTIIQVTHEREMQAYGKRTIEIRDGLIAGHQVLAPFSEPVAPPPGPPTQGRPRKARPVAAPRVIFQERD